MKADSLNLKALFQKDVRYIIPTFQRPYVWNQDDQWEPLWDDVRNVAERYLDELHGATGDMVVAEERTWPHFMGAVVLQQRSTITREIDTREVIDGQQRLTTMQLLLNAAQREFEAIGAEAQAQALARLVRNAYVDGDAAFKLWPTSLDQDAFRAAMTNPHDSEGFEDSPLVQAHEFFRLQMREWIDQAPTDEGRADRIHGLETALFGLLELVVIDLASADDAFVIFETLNARGTPLLASDLVKNYLLQNAAVAGRDVDQVYAEGWRPLEDKWWREEVRQGRLIRPRIDVFLNYWLIMRSGEEVPSQDVFPRFKAFVESDAKSALDVLQDLGSVGATYRSLDDISPSSPEGVFLDRWRVLDAGSMTPLVLWLFAQSDSQMSGEERLGCLHVLEGFLVRRMLCRLTTKDYNRLSLEVLARLRAAPLGGVAEACAVFIAEQQAESRRWPDDTELRNALRDLPLYRLLTRGRLGMVLEGVETQLRGELAEERIVQRARLQIEHIMPRAWHQHWRLPAGDGGLESERLRERLVHTIGNLTLVNPKLNVKMSNDSWNEKRRLLETNSVLHLNKQVLDQAGETGWTDEQIERRGEYLSDIISVIWPTPV